MHHSKPLPSYTCDFVHIYHTGVIVLSAQRKTEQGMRYADVYLSENTAREIQKSLNLADERHLPFGHAYWHIHYNNSDFENCATCEYIAKEESK